MAVGTMNAPCQELLSISSCARAHQREVDWGLDALP
jgi:hypothetical protein